MTPGAFHVLPPRNCISLETTDAIHRFTVVRVHGQRKTKLGFILLGVFFLLFVVPDGEISLRG